MKQNVGKTDKLIRILLGFVIIALGIYFETWWGFVGVVPLVTAFTGFCPVYRLFGVSTCKTNIKVN
jgi:hypothetical protein